MKRVKKSRQNSESNIKLLTAIITLVAMLIKLIDNIIEALR